MLKRFAVHSHHVVHGDLTGVRTLTKLNLFSSSSIIHSPKSNILLDGDLKVFLADFGLSNVVSEAGGPLYITSSIGGSVRWAAPECFRISGGSSVSPVTTHGDIYSYGGVMLQVYTMHILAQVHF
jgi:serine/threonine protein kinase